MYQDIWGKTLKAQGTGENHKCDYTKLEYLLLIKEDNRVKTQPTEWEKIFAKYTSNKKLVSRICKELKKINSKN